MLTYNARDLCNLSYDEVWKLPEEAYVTVTFDDGDTVSMSTREIILSYYLWWPLREWPLTPILPKHALQSHLTSNLILRLTEASAFDAFDIPENNIDIEYLGLRIKQELCRFYNDMTIGLEAYVTGLDALDFIDVMHHPVIKQANDEIQASDLTKPGVLAGMERAIDRVHETIVKVLLTDDSLHGNRLAEVIRAEVVSSGQVVQCVGPRGYPSDIDSHIFRYPILRGFAHGIIGLHDQLIESRSAAKALFFTKDPLQTTEYFNREMQLNVATLRNLHYHEDCGSTEYIPWTISKGNLSVTAGMWYMDTETNQLKLVRKNSLELIGRTILLRSAMTCQHKDPYGICGRCYGDLQHSVPRGTNVGHVSVTVLCAIVSQNVLSTKHLDRSASIGEIVISPFDRQFIRVHEGQLQLALARDLDPTKTKLIVDKDDVANLADLNIVDDISKLSVSKISFMDDVSFSVLDEDGDETISPVTVMMGSRKASFSTDFLSYIRKVGYTAAGDRSISIDLSGWDTTKPMWVLPRKHANMLDFLNEIKSNIKASGKNRGKEQMDITDAMSLADALTDLYDLVSQKFRVNVTHLATILRSTMIRSKRENDYRMPVPGGSRELGTYREIISMRSLSAFSAYQEQFKTFFDPKSFTIRDRAPHHMDRIIIPNKTQ